MYWLVPLAKVVVEIVFVAGTSFDPNPTQPVVVAAAGKYIQYSLLVQIVTGLVISP
jgi:hypothetical protein